MNKILTILFAAGIVILAACEKKVDPVDTFFVDVNFKNSGAKYITGNVELNPKDSIYFDVTITSKEDMSFIEIQRNGTRLDTFRLNNATNKKSFSFVKGYRADSIAGDYSYRIMARDDRAIFMGDGGKSIKVTVKPDFEFYSYRVMQVPDTVAKTNNAFFSSKTGQLYSFTTGAANSALIDFGYYYDTTSALKHTIYALNSAQPQLNYYDFTSWTKNATLLKKLPSSVNFVSQLTSGGALQTLVGGNMNSGTASKVTALATTSGNNVIGFRTADGKFGAILIRYISADNNWKTTTMEIDVKVQK